MKRKMPFAISAGLLVILLALTLSAARLALSAEPVGNSLAVAVFPKTLILGGDQGNLVSVYAKIPFRRVDVSSLTLNGISAKGAYQDKHGELVAYFDAAAVKRAVSLPSATLTLRGLTTTSAAFWGSDLVQVVPAR
jgi:hypothetical protein